jgi:hypothetical protein
MSKTVRFNEAQRNATLFVLGGRHHMQLEPHHRAALDEIEVQLRDVPTEQLPAVAPDAPGTLSPVAVRKKKGAKR